VFCCDDVLTGYLLGSAMAEYMIEAFDCFHFNRVLKQLDSDKQSQTLSNMSNTNVNSTSAVSMLNTDIGSRIIDPVADTPMSIGEGFKVSSSATGIDKRL